MILPTKHIAFSNSLLNTGAILLNRVQEQRTVTSLWGEVKMIKEIRTYHRFTLALDLLYILGLIEFNNGFLQRVKK